MSKYTTEVRYLCETLSCESEIEKAISKARPFIFNFDYPFPSTNKIELETQILQYYYTQEIGYETFERWRLALKTQMQLRMPYYDKLLASTMLDFNPLDNIDYTETKTGTVLSTESASENQSNVAKSTTLIDFSKNREGSNDETFSSSQTTSNQNNINSSTNGTNANTINTAITNAEEMRGTGTNITDETVSITSTKNSLNKYSDTPQNSLSNLESGTYLTNATQITESDSSNNTRDIDNTSSNNVSTSGSSEKTETNSSTSTNTTATGESFTGSVSTGDNKEGNFTESEDSTTNTTNNSNTDITINNDRENQSNENYTIRHYGKNSGTSYSEMLLKYRETLINIYEMVIDELAPLFMSIW